MKHNCKECFNYNNFTSLGIETCDEKPLLILNSSFPFIKTNCIKFKEITFGKEPSSVHLPQRCSVFTNSTATGAICSRLVS